MKKSAISTYRPDSKAYIDLSAIRHNLDHLTSHLKKSTRRMAVIKADAYGHGAVKVARFLKNSADWFAVNHVQEAVELREAGINTPILVFGPPDEPTAPIYQKMDITATVSTFRQFELLHPDTEYHIKMDSGMGRFGFLPNEAEEVVQTIQNRTDIRCTGIYSHLATADEPENMLARRQIDRFRTMRELFPDDLQTHFCNTGGAFFYPDAQYDMVRLGIGIYGYSPGQTRITGLRPALHWQTILKTVRKIEKGQTVSYGARWEAPQDGFLGILPVGYSDGVPRLLTGKLNVAINGNRYPVAGTITMNYCMVDLGETNIPVGTSVELLGGDAPDAQEWGARIGTIPYEILTGIDPRIERVYSEKPR